MINWKHSENTLRVSDKDLPAGLLFILRELHHAEHEAFVVGGSIRDIFLNRTVYDWDVATSATPAEVIERFERVIETGLQHGTVTVCVAKETYESADELILAAQALARDIAANAPLGVREAKRMFDEIEHLALADALDHSRGPRMALNDTYDFKEGVTAFVEKRKPVFTGT